MGRVEARDLDDTAGEARRVTRELMDGGVDVKVTASANP